jgi:riboflavin synthase alpha subunit
LVELGLSRNGTALSVNNSNKISETYNVGDTFSTEGLTVTAKYSDGSTKDVDISKCTISNTSPLTVNDTALLVSYTENEVTKSAVLRLDVQGPEITSVAYTGKTELLFSDTSAYTLTGKAAKSTWTSQNGGTFDRLRCNKNTNAYITFEHDFSALTDRSKAGFMSTMNASRGGTVIEVSNDNQTWTVLAKAQAGDNQIRADYKYIAKTINNLGSKDGSDNVYYMYYNVGQYLTNSSKLYVRYSYQAPDSGFVGLDTEGADLIHSVTFYDTLDISKAGEQPAADVTLSKIEVTTQPTKTTYEAGDTFSAAGMVVTATYSDGSEVELSSSNYTLSPTTLELGTTEINVSYTYNEDTRTTTIPITVTAKAKSALEASDYDVAAELMFTDANNYTLANNAYTNATQTRYFTDADGTEAARLRCGTNAGAYILFTYTFEGDVDLSKAGFMTYALDTRMGTVFEYSTDNTNWTTLAKVAEGDTRVSAHYKEDATNIVSAKGGSSTDRNMKKMYYNVNMGTAKTLYVKVSYVDPGWASYSSDISREGADIFGSITFFSRLDLTWQAK